MSYTQELEAYSNEHMIRQSASLAQLKEIILKYFYDKQLIKNSVCFILN